MASIDAKLRALVELGVSRKSMAAFIASICIPISARARGETQQRLDCLCVWIECPFFDDAERAALNWAESLTDISRIHAPDAAYDALTPHFSEQQIVDLTFIISTMNA